MKSLLYIKACASTNDVIMEHLTLNIPKFLGLYTFNQTKGRGQYGKTWESPKNKNLSFSFAIPVKQNEISESFINFRTVMSVRNFIANMTDERVEIKWPNDIIIKNKKVSGMMIERKTANNISYFILGIGMNVLQENFDHLPKAGSIYTQTGKIFNLTELAECFFEHLCATFSQKEDFNDVLENYQHHLFNKNKIAVYQIGELRQNGIIQSVDKEGFLWIELENDGLQKFYHKEIEMLY